MVRTVGKESTCRIRPLHVSTSSISNIKIRESMPVPWAVLLLHTLMKCDLGHGMPRLECISHDDQ